MAVLGFTRLTQLRQLALISYAVGRTDEFSQLFVMQALTSLQVSCSPEGDSDVYDGEGVYGDTLLLALASAPRIPQLSLTASVGCGFSAVSKLVTLRELDLYLERERSAESFGVFTGLTQLSALRLWNCAFMPGFCAALGRMHWLRRLHLLGCELPAPEALPPLPALADLDLQPAEHLGDAWLSKLRLSTSCPGLKRFGPSCRVGDPFYGADCKPWPEERMKEVARLTQLEQLDLSDNVLTDEALGQLRSMQMLRALHLDSCTGITCAGLKSLTCCSSLQSLTGVNVKQCDLAWPDLEKHGVFCAMVTRH